MIAIHRGQVTELVHESTRVADLIRKHGQSPVWKRSPVSRQDDDDKPLSVQDALNARRESEYVARRNGVKEPRLQLWKIQ
ncbi:hypothetical protein [Halomonas sp. IOP_31]|uniref:hypothetical protein n=1 Tax=Halomonas sp. IOP_31 TaxID=2876584 RepID=UPI001E34BEB4|nr:hypothetical protein [Halomonas sp. IOP_31]MCD6006867.1 hypothetical protein [Halomonas sp. IOP_31]